MRGLVEKFKGKGIGFIRRRFQTHRQRRKALLDDPAVEDLLILAYNLRTDDMLNGVPSCNNGADVANRLKELLI